MFTKPSRQFLQGMFVCSVLLGMMILISACSGVAGGNGQPTTGGAGTGGGSTPAATTAPTQVSTTPTQAAAAPTTAPVAFKAGGISFIGPVTSVSSSSLVMTGPDGKSYTLAISAQTDRSAYGGSSPTVGAFVNMDAIVNQDGSSFTASILKPGVQTDPDLHVIAYTGITTSAVGSDRVLRFTVGTKSYTYTLPAVANLSDFNGNAQAIANNLSVKVKVQVPANTVVSVGNASSNTGG